MVVVTGLELATGGFLAIGYLFGIGVGQVLHCLSSQGKAGSDLGWLNRVSMSLAWTYLDWRMTRMRQGRIGDWWSGRRDHFSVEDRGYIPESSSLVDS
ncbi:hypothetical protein MLD38_006468 [Melastoma candidum]|uniref:Uncharacterized protein n=1 Tax=Melastoma candidum TaxID=119954 RepID=A0ACB9RR05_9MYRT|nr:hypothetical protein MLD38_006468 [Melastoma candidum]